MTDIALYKINKPTRANAKRKVWMLRWVGTDGKRYGDTIGDAARMTKSAANAIRRERQGKTDCRVIPVNRPKVMSFVELAKLDRLLIADHRPKTLLLHDAVVGRATRAWGDVRASNVGPAHVAAIKAGRSASGKPYAADTTAGTIRVLKAMWTRAKKGGLLIDNPFTGNGVRTDPADSRIFEADEIDSMVDAAPADWWKLFVRLGASTGLRLEELLHLRWRDVDIDGGKVKVCRHDADRFAVGGTSYPLLPFSAKWSSYRTVPVLPATLDLLRRMKAKGGRSAYVFLSLQRLAAIDARMAAGTLRPSYQTVNNVLRDFQAVIQPAGRALLAERRGVPLNDVGWIVGCVHDLRDTYGSQMSWHVPANVLMRLMGHSDIKTTMRYYAHATASEAEAVRAAVAASGLGGQTDTQLTPDPNKHHSSVEAVA